MRLAPSAPACIALALGALAAMLAMPASAEGPSAIIAPTATDAPSLTRAEIDGVLAALAEAHRREDAGSVVSLHDSSLKVLVGAAARRLFQDRNYLRLETRVVETRTAGGAVDVEVVQVLRSRRVGESADRREKSRWVYSMARQDRGIIIVSSHAPPPEHLPPVSPWEPKSFTGRVVLRPASGRAEGDADVRVVVTARNDSAEPQGKVAMLLHPFAEAVDVRQGETLLEAVRSEGGVDTWVLTLAQPVAPGDDLELTFAYRIAEIGLGPNSSIGPDGARLMPASCWLPTLRPPRRDDLIRATHDFTVETPPDLSAALPGRFESVEELEGGRRAWRWRSQHSGGDLMLLAGRWKHERVRATDRLSLDVFRAAEAPPRIPQSSDPGLVARAVSMLRFLDGLAPAPVERMTLVEGATPAFVSGPELISLPDFEQAWGRADDKETQPFFFMAHHLAHAWVVDGAAPTGLGASNVAEGLCDHLASAWAETEVDPALPRLYRGAILGGIGESASVDRPLVASRDVAPMADVFGIGKAFLVLDTYRELAGDERWRERLGAWLAGARGRDIKTLVTTLGEGDPVLERYCERFFLHQGFAEARIMDVSMRDPTAAEVAASGIDPDAWHRCDVRIASVGLGPIPLRVGADINGTIELRDVVLEEGITTVSFDAMGLPRSVRIDPDRVLWTSTSDDDFWPAQPLRRQNQYGRAKAPMQRGEVHDVVSPWRDALPQR